MILSKYCMVMSLNTCFMFIKVNLSVLQACRIKPLFHQCSSRAGLEPVPQRVSTIKQLPEKLGLTWNQLSAGL